MNRQEIPLRKDRQTGPDLIRILAMVLITMIHYIGYSGILEAEAFGSVNHLLLTALHSLSKAGVNLFVLITGYFMASKTVTIQKVVRLLVDVGFASVILLVFGAIFSTAPLSASNLVRGIFPFTTFSYWYVNTYVLLLLIAPFLNKIIRDLGEKRHKGLLIFWGILICILLVMNPFVNATVYIGHSNGIVWFAFLYMTGAYLKQYALRLPKYGYAVVGGCSLCALVVIELISDKLHLPAQMQLLENNSIFVFLLSLSIFVLLKDVKLSNQKVGNVLFVLSSASFFIYLIQEHVMIRPWIWKQLHITDFAGSWMLWVHFAGSVLLLWPIAILIKFLSQKWFCLIRPLFTKGTDWIEKKCSRLAK